MNVIKFLLVLTILSIAASADVVSAAEKAIKSGAVYKLKYIKHANKSWPVFDCSGFVQYIFHKEKGLISAKKKMLSAEMFRYNRHFKKIKWADRKRNDIFVMISENDNHAYHIGIITNKHKIITPENTRVGIVEIPAFVSGHKRPRIKWRNGKGSDTNSYSKSRAKHCIAYRWVK